MSDEPRTIGPSASKPPAGVRISELIEHCALALGQHVNQRHHSGLPVPRDIEELAAYLLRLARNCLEESGVTAELQVSHHSSRPARLLVTKHEAAARLAVPVSTIERLVATGRLPQVQVETLAMFRVSDLKAYVQKLSS
jgi:excisionase family DNA binding protein